jgi:hypothetical protein
LPADNIANHYAVGGIFLPEPSYAFSLKAHNENAYSEND